MSVTPASEQLPFLHNTNPNIPYEIVQYLSHEHTNQSLPVILPVGELSYQDPIDVHPTFSATPQSEYYSSVTLPDGQVMHQSSSQNVFRVFSDKETGRPFTISGHEVTLHFLSPLDNQSTWQMELFMPADDRLRAALEAMMPTDGTAASESAFPVHATFCDVEPAPPLEMLSTQTMSPLHDSEDSPAIPRVLLPTSTSLPALLSADIDQRIAKTLSQIERDDLFDGPLSDIDEEEFGQTIIGSDSGDGLGICEHCLESAHESLMDCPHWGTEAREEPTTTPICEESKAPSKTGVWYYQDDILLIPPFTTRAHPDQERQEELQQVLDTALCPVLKDLLQLPITKMDSFQQLAKTAQQVRRTYNEFVSLIAARWEEQKVWDEMTRNINEHLLTMLPDSDSDNDFLPDLVPIPRTLTPTTQIHLDDPRVVDKGMRKNMEHWAAAAAKTPVFDHQRGPVITRKLWSSSPSPSMTSSTSSFNHIEPYNLSTSGPDVTALNEHIAVVQFPKPSSPAVTEWSVSSWDYNISPRDVIDMAIDRILTDSPEHMATPENIASPVRATESFTDHESFRDNVTPEILRVITNNAEQPLALQLRTLTAADQDAELSRWVYENTRGRQQQRRWENDMCGVVIHNALWTLYRPLRDYLDVCSPTAEGRPPGLTLLANVSMGLDSRSDPTSTIPDPTQSATSLNFSLPDSGPAINATTTGPTNAGANSEVNMKQKAREEDVHSPRPKKRFPIQLTDASVTRMFAGVRLAILEGGHRIEQLVWEQYKVTEANFPSAYIWHPLLHDDKAAKLHTLWNVLQRNGHYLLASFLGEALTFRLRDEYAVSRLFNANYLINKHPHSQYWELLPFKDIDSLTGPAAIDFRIHNEFLDYYPQNDGNYYSDDEYYGTPSEDSDMDELRYPTSDDEQLPTDSMLFSTGDSPVYTDDDMDSEADTVTSIIYKEPADGISVFYIRRVGDWFRGLDEPTLSDTDKQDEELRAEEELVAQELARADKWHRAIAI
ncbi:hypothetical protein B0H17DRAFT_1213286 [Mycena rosella]|uniref:Uncharacterized protein n=1 Tax=Mycena rosella TaxID=1033263 RepID=A0AAD7CQI2_MYCRO|nr:hypothetical protein B0H17DRAFT_1213286 [Mycena rosella]